ncbi:hypothetical protein FHQ28_05430 [Pasteurellaceae bacterium USgator11]|nr:hypothetical protein FHQ19_09365 [Pasteurellaceae bacterium UScroc12]TNG94757.1 hypothetical protein FHQ20_08170 [Pasteurellaceae bacterium USgator41]TNG97728.1 hypothetical protein FHQ24_09960 [Pasteurellaceae bacterium UScroc31]TNH01689.1 hypothetical protein FHQ28_05430 [Pasteurellaceae bacterium USgator11]
MNKIKDLLPLAFLVLALGVVGQMDYADHVASEKNKCELSRGTWIADNPNNQYCQITQSQRGEHGSN